jgi:hypothetical protein
VSRTRPVQDETGAGSAPGSARLRTSGTSSTTPDEASAHPAAKNSAVCRPRRLGRRGRRGLSRRARRCIVSGPTQYLSTPVSQTSRQLLSALLVGFSRSLSLSVHARRNGPHWSRNCLSWAAGSRQPVSGRSSERVAVRPFQIGELSLSDFGIGCVVMRLPAGCFGSPRRGRAREPDAAVPRPRRPRRSQRPPALVDGRAHRRSSR